MVAVATSVPDADGRTSAEAVNVTLLFAGKFTPVLMFPEPDAVAGTAPFIVVELQVMLESFVVSKVALTNANGADEGPALVAVIV